ncbi:MAG: ubiquinol-cytochrome c reductase iron-sulfur subunit [Acidimicrobiales bacterium]
MSDELPAAATVPVSADDPRLKPASRHPRRAEALVASLFVISFFAAVALATTYSVGGQTQIEGGFLGLAFGALGAGLAAWAKYLMPKGPFVEARDYEDRHDLASKPEDRQAFVGAFGRGAVVLGRRRMLMGLLGAAGAAVGAVLIFPLRSLGPQPKQSLFHTAWKKGTRLVRDDGTPVNVSDIDVGGYITVFPEGGEADPNIQQTAQTLLIHVATDPIETRQGPKSWSPYGYLAFSKVCTHAGCPVSLYEAQTQQLLCPCHQSLFDILEGAFPIFGPAPRPLPQLAIYTDGQGNFRARHDYLEPIGPGFWERGPLPKGGYYR